MNLALVLGIDLPHGSRQLMRSLHKQLRAAIVDGRLKPGIQLPSTRDLANMLLVSRSTVATAYDLLVSEGYLAARHGAGHFVAEFLTRKTDSRVVDSNPLTNERLGIPWRDLSKRIWATVGPHTRFDFRIGLPDTKQLAFDVWRRLSARALRTFSRAPTAYGASAGQPALRDAIARHISFTRAVACDAADVLVTAGTQQAIDLLARILVTPGQTMVAVEEPGYPPVRKAFTIAGANVVMVPVDSEGLRVDCLPIQTKIIYVTPSHQFPLGMVLSPRRRMALLDFAQKHNAVIIEDDYDGEFRYGERPLDALHTLDRTDSVFYVGTFSKSLFQALRLGFVVAPAWAYAALTRAKELSDRHCDVVSQETLAAFIAEGHLMRHLRKMNRVYAERRVVLSRAIGHYFGDALTPIPSEAGLHLTARVGAQIKVIPLVKSAADAGIALQPVDLLVTGKTAPNFLVFGYGLIASEEIDDAIRELSHLAIHRR